MSTSSQPEEIALDVRGRALLAALSSHAATQGRAQEILLHHPDSDFLGVQLAGREEPFDLDQTLWHELEDAEQVLAGEHTQPARRTPASYWLRRREISRWISLQRVARTLPAYWQGLLQWAASRIKQQCTALGIDLIVQCADGLDRNTLMKWLGPLGPEVGTQVVNRLIKTPEAEIDVATIEQCRAAYKQIARKREGADIAAVLARVALATLYHQMPEHDRHAAAAVCHSNLCKVLDETRPLKTASLGEIKQLEQMVARHFDPAGG